MPDHPKVIGRKPTFLRYLKLKESAADDTV